MSDKELRKLSRAELLALLLEQTKENEQLYEKLEQAQTKLSSNTINLDTAGSIAEAALQISGVFEAAQSACDIYTENIERLSSRQKQICMKMEQETRIRCDRMIAEAERKAKAYWDNIYQKVQDISSSTVELRNLLDKVYSKVNNAPNEDIGFESIFLKGKDTGDNDSEKMPDFNVENSTDEIDEDTINYELYRRKLKNIDDTNNTSVDFILQNQQYS